MSHVSIIAEDLFLLVKSVKRNSKVIEKKTIPKKRVINV